MILASELARRLAQTPPADVPAVRLFVEMRSGGGLDVTQLLARREEIEAAADRLEEQVAAAQEIVERCGQIQPIPSRRVPPGI